jgi:hypothetical protein
MKLFMKFMQVNMFNVLSCQNNLEGGEEMLYCH